jgi:hypothetical protein
MTFCLCHERVDARVLIHQKYENPVLLVVCNLKEEYGACSIVPYVSSLVPYVRGCDALWREIDGSNPRQF